MISQKQNKFYLCAEYKHRLVGATCFIYVGKMTDSTNNLFKRALDGVDWILINKNLLIDFPPTISRAVYEEFKKLGNGLMNAYYNIYIFRTKEEVLRFANVT